MPQRVLIIGCSGAGKSHLSRLLAEYWQLPLIHLDAEYWQPGWVEPNKADWRERVKALADGERWLMDGNYGGTLDLRLPKADLVIWLDFSRWVSLRRVLSRTIRYWGKARPDMNPGCPERFDWIFFHYVLTFPEKHRPRLLKHFENHPPARMLQFSSPQQLNQWAKEGYKLKN